MLPRVATTTGTLQPSLALQAGVPVDAAVKPQLSAAALANLRAEVLLRLIETMLRHMPRSAEPSPGRDLLETLLVVLKALPGREGESGRKLADLLARLPPDLRPGVEKLIGTVLSSLPTRALIDVVRNPNGPEAIKLATLLMTSLDADDLPAARAENQQKPLGLNAQQLAAVGRHGPQQAAQPVQILGDARALQTMLKRIFDLDAGGKPRPASERAMETRQDLAAPSRLPMAEKAAVRAEQHPPMPTARTGHKPPVDAAGRTPRHNGGAEEAQTAASAMKRADTPAKAQVANAAGQTLARSVLQAIARDLPPALLAQAAAHLVENLTPEEARFLRTLLQRPLEPTGEQELAVAASGPPAAEEAIEADMAPEGGKLRPGTAQAASPLPDQTAEADDPLPMPQAREALQAALADTRPDRLLPATVLREGVPLAFVPYLPAEEDLEWPESREAEQDEEAGEDEAGGNEESREETGEDREASGDEPETPGMAKRREKTVEMVGIIEPGLVFYQKLGDYWT